MARTGLKGKGLKLLHCYTDQLWALGDKAVPDAGFTPQRIFPQVRCARRARALPAAGAQARVRACLPARLPHVCARTQKRGPACRLAARLAQVAAGEPGAPASASAPAQAPPPQDGGAAAGAAAGGAPAGGAAGAPPEEHGPGAPDAGAGCGREAGAGSCADGAANGHAGAAPGDAGGGVAGAGAFAKRSVRKP